MTSSLDRHNSSLSDPPLGAGSTRRAVEEIHQITGRLQQRYRGMVVPEPSTHSDLAAIGAACGDLCGALADLDFALDAATRALPATCPYPEHLKESLGALRIALADARTAARSMQCCAAAIGANPGPTRGDDRPHRYPYHYQMAEAGP